MKAIILAGGFGTRIAAIANGLPKPLLKVAGKPILQHQVEFLRDNGLDDIRLSLHYKADQIIEFCERMWPGRMEFVVEKEPLGTGGAIKFAARDLGEQFLVVNGDILSDIDLNEFLSLRASAVCCTFLEDARDFGLIEVKDGKVNAFYEKPKEKIPGYINAGFYLLTQDAFSHVSRDTFMIEQDVFPHLARQGLLGAYIHNGFWIDVGTRERFERAGSGHQFYGQARRA